MRRRTTRGRFAARSDVEPVTPTRLRGELLDRDELPLAFVFGEDRPLYRLEGDRLQRCGTARRYARFAVERILEHDSGELVEGPDELVLRRDAVRLATPQGPPAGVAPDERWIHVDLPEQVIVAYEGSRPVFASLVSTGRRGHTTPTGLYRIRSKHVSATMRGEDDDKGWYEVEEVPWTMYYRRLYAIHGAYWHDGFGEVRSHGCTNLAPADARWLFHWTSPKVPAGWHGLYGRGTRVLFTD